MSVSGEHLGARLCAEHLHVISLNQIRLLSPFIAEETGLGSHGCFVGSAWLWDGESDLEPVSAWLHPGWVKVSWWKGSGTCQMLSVGLALHLPGGMAEALCPEPCGVAQNHLLHWHLKRSQMASSFHGMGERQTDFLCKLTDYWANKNIGRSPWIWILQAKMYSCRVARGGMGALLQRPCISLEFVYYN